MIQTNLKSSDRVLILEPIDNKVPLSSIGLVDPRLFKEGTDSNKLHAIMDNETCLWNLKYEKGAVPAALKGEFTSFTALKKHTDNYFKNRNVRIKEVRD
jgi:hypothetical protein